MSALVQSPPREAILTSETIMKRCPGAPVKREGPPSYRLTGYVPPDIAIHGIDEGFEHSSTVRTPLRRPFFRTFETPPPRRLFEDSRATSPCRKEEPTAPRTVQEGNANYQADTPSEENATSRNTETENK